LNHLRFEPGHIQAIRYNAAWLTFIALLLLVSLLLPLLVAINRRLACSQGLLGAIWPAA